MKKIFIILLLFQVVIISAQKRSGNGQKKQNSQNSNQENAPKEFNPLNEAELFFYEENDVISKLKLKGNTSKEQKVIATIKNYNKEINTLLFLNRAEFEKLKYTVDMKRKSAMNVRNMEEMQDLKAKINSTIDPVKFEVVSLERELNHSLTTILSEKEYKKWLSYQKKEKANLKPSSEGRNSGPNNLRR